MPNISNKEEDIKKHCSLLNTQGQAVKLERVTGFLNFFHRAVY
jgi:hypothetical protein